jgi:hypothetical protein
LLLFDGSKQTRYSLFGARPDPRLRWLGLAGTTHPHDHGAPRVRSSASPLSVIDRASMEIERQPKTRSGAQYFMGFGISEGPVGFSYGDFIPVVALSSVDVIDCPAPNKEETDPGHKFSTWQIVCPSIFRPSSDSSRSHDCLLPMSDLDNKPSESSCSDNAANSAYLSMT